MRNIAFGFACRIVCWTLLAPAVHAGELTIGNLLITQAWSRATPGGTPGGTLRVAISPSRTRGRCPIVSRSLTTPEQRPVSVRSAMPLYPVRTASAMTFVKLGHC